MNRALLGSNTGFQKDWVTRLVRRSVGLLVTGLLKFIHLNGGKKVYS